MTERSVSASISETESANGCQMMAFELGSLTMCTALAVATELRAPSLVNGRNELLFGQKLSTRLMPLGHPNGILDRETSFYSCFVLSLTYC